MFLSVLHVLTIQVILLSIFKKECLMPEQRFSTIMNISSNLKKLKYKELKKAKEEKERYSD